MNNDILKAAEIIKEGGIVIFPTDTAFGIGCRIDDAAAVKRLFRIRKRPINQATPVLVSGIAMAEEYLNYIPDDIKEKLLQKYWPGALTIVFECKKDRVPELVRGSGENLGVRMPDSEIALRLINEVGVPILGPSANFHGEKTPYALQDLDPKLLKLVDYVLDGRCKHKLASTVIDCSTIPWHILRKGALDIKI